MSLFDCPRGNTFHHYNELSASQIDFIVGSRQLNLKIQPLESSPQNTSTHIPVRASLTSYLITHSQAPEAVSCPPRLKWDKANRAHIAGSLSHHSNIPGKKLDINDATAHIISILSEAASLSVPRPSPKSAISSAMRQSRHAYKMWVTSGKPGHRDQTSSDRRQAKQQLRREMRQETARRRTSLYDELMQTHTNHDKLFYKLVAAQRSKPRTSISSIMVDDRLLTDEVEVLNAWADHFESLGRPLMMTLLTRTI